MAETTHIELRKARDAIKMTRWKLGQAIGVSESTIERWENGEARPDPDDVDRIGEAVGDPTLWHRWMCSNCESYRRRYRGQLEQRGELALAVMRLRHETEDVTALQDAVERDVMSDGVIDDPDLAARYAKEIRENIAAETAVLNWLQRQGGTTND